MDKLKIAVCDDEKPTLTLLERKTRDLLAKDDLAAGIELFSGGGALLKRYDETEHPFDIILLDIKMDDMDGIETARRIREKDGGVYIVFITSSAEYVFRGYEVKAFRYLMKTELEYGFDKVLRQAWEDGKVMCGVSAGGNCWFEECSTDSLRIQTGNYDLPLTSCDCLGFMPGMFVPHCDEAGRQESVKDLLKDTGQFALQMSNCTALEIMDDAWRLITTDASGHGIEAYGLKTRWVNNEYCVEQLDRSAEWKPLAQLLAK